MKTPEEMKQKNLEQELETLLKDIREFVGNGNYIFRGENNKDYGRISSKLYRYFQTIVVHAELQKKNIVIDFSSIKQILESQLTEQLGKKTAQKIDFAIMEKSLKENVFAQLVQNNDQSLRVENIQNELILKDVQEYVDFENEINTLAELQHYGGSTNLIDFSQDLSIALFFACDGESQKDGRLILLRANVEGVKPPRKNQNNRAVFQKSIFVRRDKGYIDEREVEQIIVPKNLKPSILTYVQNYFDIRTETIYGDLMGYIQNQKRHGEAYKQFFAGSIYGNEGNFAEEIKCYTKAIDLKPNFAAAYNNRGSAKMNLNPHELEEAIADFKDAIKLNRNYDEAYNNCGVAYGKSGEYGVAIAYYTKAIELNPNNAEAYNNRSASYSNVEENDLAIVDCNKSIELNPNNPQAYNNRGIAYKNKGDNDFAIADFNKAIALNPNRSSVYKNLGIVYNNKGENDLAIAYYNKAIEIDPDYAEAYNNRGIIYNNKKEYDIAINDYNKAIELNPNLVEAYNNRGVIYDKKGDHDFAIADFNKAIALNPGHIPAYSNRGNAYRNKGENDNALADLNKAIEIIPNLVEAYVNRGLTKKALLDIKGAKKDFETALQLAEQRGNNPFAAHIQKEIDDLPADSDS